MRDPWYELTRKSRRERPWRRVLATGAAVATGAILVVALAAALTGLSAANRTTAVTPAAVQAEIGALRRELDDVRGRLALSEVRAST